MSNSNSNEDAAKLPPGAPKNTVIQPDGGALQPTGFHELGSRR